MMICLALLASLVVFASAQNTNVQYIDGVPTVVGLYSSTVVPPTILTKTVTESTGTVTHTLLVTIDEFMPMTATVIQKQLVTSTDYVKNTQTDTVTNTYKTPVDPKLVVTQLSEHGQVFHETATDIETDHHLATKTEIDVSTIVHTVNDVVLTTTTAWLEQTQTYNKVIVKTEIEHVFSTLTVYKTVTDTRIINPATRHVTNAPVTEKPRYY